MTSADTRTTRSRQPSPRAVPALLVGLLTLPSLAFAQLALAPLALAPLAPAPADPPREETAKPPTLADASQSERDLIERLRHSRSWVRRAFAAERLARFECDPSREYLLQLLDDEAWRVRAFAILALARRHVPLSDSTFAREPEQRVIRTALRCRYPVPKPALITLIERLDRSDKLTDRMMALELTLAAGLADGDGKASSALSIDPLETLSEIIGRMDRIEAGELSPRLAAITNGADSGRTYKWREWLRKNKRDPGLVGAFVVSAGTDGRGRGPIAELPLQRMLDLESHMQDLSTKSIDLAIALDCTSSMSAEIAECQSGIDSLMLFAQDVAKSARIGIVGYRDEQDEFETKGWDLTGSLDEARDRLWQLSADGGGDRPEAVLPALKLAYSKMSWQPDAMKSVILVGDAPPKPGTGDQCVELARRAYGKSERERAERSSGRRSDREPPRDPLRNEPSHGDAAAEEPHRGIRTYTIAPHGEADDETAPAAPLSMPPAAPKPEQPGVEGGKDSESGPAQRHAKRPLSPWRQKLKPGQVEYWKEIAEAGGGRTVTLPRDASLIAEIAGLTLGDTYQEEFESFFESWFALCR